MNNSDQNIAVFSGENNNYFQIGNAYLQDEVTVGKVAADPFDRIFIDGDAIRLVIKAFAYTFKEAKHWVDNTEPNKYMGQVSTIMTVLTKRLEI